MGMFDGSADSMPSSTADVARLLAAPVILVVDASAMSSSVAALVHGYSTLRPDVGVSAVVLNQVGSHGHELLLREALASLGVSVVGALPRDDSLSWRDRHLGLVPVAEQPESVAKSLDRLAATVSSHVDLEAVLALARSAPPARFGSVALPAFHTAVRIGVASGKAFSFTYTDTVEALEAAGAEVVPFDPLAERSLPEALDGVIIGGGFPEVHAAELADNRPLLDDLCARIASGMPTWAECGGLLLLCQSLDGHRMAGILPARAQMTAKLTLGYRLARTTSASPVGPSGTPMRGHEFHYSELDRPGAAMLLESRWGTRPEGWASPKMLATYLHHHPGGDPGRVAAFVATAARASEPAAD
jgi:cobyrinic acid a,c-diamide synthase